MTTSEASPQQAYVWVWLPGATDPVVAGIIQANAGELVFAYGRSYLERPNAIALQPDSVHGPGLPLIKGPQRPPAGLDAHGVIRDAAPDSWGQQVILRRQVGRNAVDTADLPLLTYLLESGSNRIGALDMQTAPDLYTQRSTHASLVELVEAGDRLARGVPFSRELDDALTFGSSVGGARPKALVTADGKEMIAKFSVATDVFPWMQAEALGMELARRCGVQTAPAKLITAAGRDVLLVHRFDRPGAGTRRQVISALSLLGLHELAARHATYTELADLIRLRFVAPTATLHELFRRIVVNVILGNTDDHARNHAAFWDGTTLELTPAYDICPQPRTTGETYLAMAYGPNGERRARLSACKVAATIYGLTGSKAASVIDECVTVIRESYDDACAEIGVSDAAHDLLLGRAIVNPSIFYTD
jgi:serine/threonine-protein kinase HipA